MPAATLAQSSFASGEWSPYATGRFDLPTYRRAMATCFNGLPIETEAWTRRPGSQFAAASVRGKKARKVRFDFAQASPYTCEFATDGVTGWLSFRVGKTLVTTNDDQGIVGVSTDSPAVVATGPHGWSTGDVVFPHGLGTGVPVLQNRQFVITVIDASHFSLADAITGAPVDGSQLGAAFAGGQMSRRLILASPYTSAAALATIRLVQTDGSPDANGGLPFAVIFNAGYNPYLLAVTALPTSTAFASFTLGQMGNSATLDNYAFQDGPYQAPPQSLLDLGVTLTHSGQSGQITLTPSASGVTGLGSIAEKSALVAPGQGYAPGDTITLAGGTETTRAVLTVTDTQVVALAIVAHGSGGTDGPATIIGTTGTGVKFQASVVILGGVISVFQSITVAGDYTANPTSLASEPVVGGGLVGATVSLTMGVKAALVTTPGLYTTTPASPVAQLSTSGSGTGATFTMTWAPLNVFSAGDVGRLIRLFSQPDTWIGNLGYAGGDSVTVFSPAGQREPTAASYWTAISPFTSPLSPPWLNPSIWQVAQPPAAIWTWGLITAVNPASGVASVTILGPPLIESAQGASKIYLWRKGLYGGSTGWPTCGTYHEGRIWMGGAVPNRIDGCESNQILPLSMSPTENDGAVTDANAVSYVFNAPDASQMYWIEPDQQGLIVGTQGGEWLVQATTVNEPLTPTSAQAHRVTKVRCANVEPARCDLTLAFVQANQRKVMEYFADVFSGKLTAPNLSENAMHLGVGSFQEVRYQHSVNPIIWTRDGDGALAGATYRRTRLFSSEKPDFVGWHRHALGSGYVVNSLAVGPSVSSGLDALTLVTEDPSGVNYVEVLTDAFDEADTLTDAVFLDQATQPTSALIAGPSPTNPQGTITFNGLWHFNGKTVSLWAAGIDVGDYPVANGSMTVPFGDGVSGGAGGGAFTQAAWAASGVAWAGYNYFSDGALLPPVDPREAGTQDGPALAKVQRGQRYGAKLVNTWTGSAYGAVRFGGSFDRLRTAYFKSQGGNGTQAVPQTQMFTGIHYDTLDDTYTRGASLCWRVERPGPMTLTAIVDFLHTAGG